MIPGVGDLAVLVHLFFNIELVYLLEYVHWHSIRNKVSFWGYVVFGLGGAHAVESIFRRNPVSGSQFMEPALKIFLNDSRVT